MNSGKKSCLHWPPCFLPLYPPAPPHPPFRFIRAIIWANECYLNNKALEQSGLIHCELFGFYNPSLCKLKITGKHQTAQLWKIPFVHGVGARGEYTASMKSPPTVNWNMVTRLFPWEFTPWQTLLLASAADDGSRKSPDLSDPRVEEPSQSPSLSSLSCMTSGASCGGLNPTQVTPAFLCHVHV